MNQSDTKIDGNKNVDTALDSVLRAAGSALEYYTLPGNLERMREAMRAVMSESYSERQMDIVIDSMEEIRIHFAKGPGEPGTAITITQGMPGLGTVEIKGESQAINYKIVKGTIEEYR